MIKLTIVTPTFNRVNELSMNFNSVLSQIFNNIEHIIIDNMSNDGTEELVNNYIKDAPYPVIYVREPDTGIYNAMNKGIQRASGEWVHILNSDDHYYSSDVLEKIFLKDLEQYEIIANGIFVKYDQINQKDFYWQPQYNSKLKHFDFPHPGLFVKNQFYKSHDLYSEKFKIISDAVYSIKNFPGSKYYINNEPIVVFSVNGASNQRNFNVFSEKAYCILFIQKFSLSHKIVSLMKLVIEYCRFHT